MEYIRTKDGRIFYARKKKEKEPKKNMKDLCPKEE